MITFMNFYKGTRGAFKGCKTPNKKPDYISPSGSLYWYTGDYIYRFSNHWSNGNKPYGVGFISSCLWYLKSNKNIEIILKKGGCGKINLKDLRTI